MDATISKQIAFSLFTALILSSCSVFQSVLPASLGKSKSYNLEGLDKLVEMSKGPCYGRCEVYSLVVYTNGVVTYEGKSNTSLLGLYARKIKDSELNELKKLLVESNLDRFREAYRGTVPDLQSVKITYHQEDKIKSITGKDGRPDEVMAVQAALEQLTNSTDWQAYVTEDALPNYVVKNQIRLQLREDVDVNAWARKYSRQEMRVIRNMSASSNFWLVQFNAKKNDPREVLAIVQADLQVISAEFNRQ